MITIPNIQRLADVLTGIYRVKLTGAGGKDNDGFYIDFRPVDLDASEGFVIRIRLGWRSLSAYFLPGNFSARLIETMGDASPAKKEIFKAFAQTASASGGELKMQVNNLNVNPFYPSEWPKNWKRLGLSLKFFPVIMDQLDEAELEEKVITCASRLTGMVLSLLPLEEESPYFKEIEEGLPEGAVIRIEVNRYERNSMNRAACIDIKGTSCVVCGFNFEKFYGPIGKWFIHVHHVVPVSRLGEGYIVNPATDLEPVCANCHAMLHQYDPPLSIEQLKEIIRLNG